MFVNKTPRLTQMAWNFIIGADWLFIWANFLIIRPTFRANFVRIVADVRTFTDSCQVNSQNIGADFVRIVADVPNFY